ncbi:MAG: hypothetical protein DRN20_03010, partial [Thermoplasmata archaeon]
MVVNRVVAYIKNLGLKKIVAISIVIVLVLAFMGRFLMVPKRAIGIVEFKILENEISAPETPALFFINDNNYMAGISLIPVFVDAKSESFVPLFFARKDDEVGGALQKYGFKEKTLADYGRNPVDISINITEMYWRKISMAIVVENYSWAVRCAPLASLLRTPVLYYSQKTLQFLANMG